MFSAGEPSQAPKPWAVVLDSGRGVGRLIPRCRRFATVQAVSGHTPQAVGVVLDSVCGRWSPDSTV